MKINRNPLTTLAAFTVATVVSTGLASAATHYTKGGMQTTDNYGASHATGASDLPMLAPGVQELGLNGRLNWEDSTVYSFDISYGRFLTSNWLVGIEAGITGVNSDKDYRAGVFAEYNFLTGTKWVPFIRATAGYARPDQGDNSATLDLDAGVKYFMRPNLAISASVGGGWVLSGDGDDGFDKQLDLGLRFYF